MLEERDEMTNDAVVQLDGALVLRKRGRLRTEACDDVIAGFAPADGIGELATPPVIQLQISGITQKIVEAAELLVDGGVFERRVEDVDRLVLARHASAILPLVVSA